MKKKTEKNKLWVERYRPKKLADMVGQIDTVEELGEYTTNTEKKQTIPHFLLTGPAGTGKTTSAKILVHLIQGDVMKRNITYLELNASDKRGIDVVRYDIKKFAQDACPIPVVFKIIILDEADSMCLQANTLILCGHGEHKRLVKISELPNKKWFNILSVDQNTGNVEPDKGKLVNSGIADFFTITLVDGRSIIASLNHPFFILKDNKIVEMKLCDLKVGDKILCFARDAGMKKCEVCGKYIVKQRFCSIECANKGHAIEMSGSGNPSFGKEAWNCDKTMQDDPRIAKQVHYGTENGNYGGTFHGTRFKDYAPDVQARWRKCRSDRLKGKTYTEIFGADRVNEMRNRRRKKSIRTLPLKSYRYGLKKGTKMACESCGMLTKVGGINGIYVHHKDGNHNNNDSNNLLRVCPKCHNMILHDNTSTFLEKGWAITHNRSKNEVDCPDEIEIKSIEYCGKEEAWNITVKKNHNFILGNGILTHNTNAAQQALRRTMEKHASNCRFILCCNYSNKIIEPIQSRCSFHKFAPLTEDQIITRLKYIANREDVIADESAFQALAYISDGDIRKAINYFQAASVMDDLVTANVVYQISGQIDPHEITTLIALSIEKKLVEARAQLTKLFDEYGMSATNIVKQMSRELHKMSIDDHLKFSIDRLIGETEFRVIQGATERIQMGALIARIILLQN